MPVSVEDCPEQSSATANITPAMLVPSSGASSRCASLISVTTRPRLKNTAADITRIAAFTSSAPLSATTESMRLKRHAVRFAVSRLPDIAASAPAPNAGTCCAASPSRPSIVTARYSVLAVERRDEPGDHFRGRRLRPEDFHEEAAGDSRDQRQHERLDRADPEAL